MAKINLVFCILVLLLQTSCWHRSTTYSLHSEVFFGYFDTYFVFHKFTASRAEFDEYALLVEEELGRLHMLFDIHHEYEGINNLKTVNLNAGLVPVHVDGCIIQLIMYGAWAYGFTYGAVNIAFGSVLELWRPFLLGEADGPPYFGDLEEANRATNINAMGFDTYSSTVFLGHGGMSIDVGSIAKGYALTRIAGILGDNGSWLLDFGGDVLARGFNHDADRYWRVGIRNPANQNEIIKSVDVQNKSVASSGNYLRSVILNDSLYHHIIDPSTLMPARGFAQTTAIHENPIVAEALSTAMFILPFNEGLRLVESIGAAGIWVLEDGEVVIHQGGDAFTLPNPDPPKK